MRTGGNVSKSIVNMRTDGLSTYHGRAGDRVRVEVVVNLLLGQLRNPVIIAAVGSTYVGRVARVGSLDEARDLARRRGARASAAHDIDLSAAHVELGRAARVVNAQRLDPEQVLAARDALGDVVRVRH